MCFHSQTKRFKIAKKDIKCYKMLIIPKNYFIGVNECLLTPVANKDVSKDIWTGKSPFVACGKLKAEKNLGKTGGYIITKGVIHTFKYMDDAAKYVGKDSVLFECVIPKGEKYIEGSDGWFFGYISKSIKFVKKIN